MAEKKLRLAMEAHPYSPASWLDKEAAEKYLWRARSFPTRLTVGFCRKHGIDVSSTGHIRLLSLEQYLARWQAEEAQYQADLNGQ
jgi:hypothetical protein